MKQERETAALPLLRCGAELSQTRLPGRARADLPLLAAPGRRLHRRRRRDRGGRGAGLEPEG